MSANGEGTLASASQEGQALQLEVVRPRLKNTLHSNGHTSLEYDTLSNKLISCNHTDTEIYLFQVDKLEEDSSSSEHFSRKEFGDDPSITVMFVKIANKKHALVALSNFRVELYTYPEWEKNGLLVRFDSPPTCARLNWDESFVAIGSQDGTLKVVEMESPHRFKIFEGHSGPILDVQYDPSEDYLVSSSCDGTVRVWNSGNRKCLKVLTCVPVSNDLENCKSMAKCAWQPRVGNLLAVPAEKKVMFFDRRLSSFLDSPRFHFNVPPSLNQDFVSMVCWHPGSSSEDNTSLSVKEERSVMALVTVSTDVILAEFNGQSASSSVAANQSQAMAMPVTALRCIQGKQNKVTSFVWMPNSHNFVIADDIGMVYFYTGCVPVTVVQKKDSSAVSAGNSAPKMLMNETVKGADEILNEMAVGGSADTTSFEDDGEDGSISLDQIKQSYVMEVERGPDANADEQDASGNVNSQGLPLDPAARDGMSSATAAMSVGPPVEVISYQPPLQPASSPVNLSVRYMKWNLVGIVRRDEGIQDDALSEEEQSASITVEFHDSTFHHSLHLKDEHGYTLADLSEEALVLAAPSSTAASSDGSSVSVITCNTFSFWDHSNQWSSNLPVGEKALALCISSQSWLAVATSQSLLRLFSVSGIQLSVVMLPGHLTSIAAGVNELLHVYQPSQTLQRDKFYSASIYSVTGFHANLTLTQQFPLSQADDSVVWIGYSQEGDAAVAFNSGPLYLLKRSAGTGGHCWMPVFNSRQQLNSKSDRLWIVGVAGTQLRAVYCKASKFPAQLPKPILLTYPLGLPLCNAESEQSQLEMQLQTQRLFEGSLSDQQVQSAFLKLFALACRTDRDCRAVDICSLMPNEETVILAIKYATKLKKLTLANKLSAIAHQKSTANTNGSPGREVDEETRGAFVDLQDENSRSLFNSQSQQYSYETTEPNSMGDNNESSLLASNPILRRTASTSNKLAALANRSGSTDLNGSTDSVSVPSPADVLAKRRVNPFLREDTSSVNKLDCSGSSVFDSLQLLKPDKLRSKSSSSSDLKSSLGRKKSSAVNNSSSQGKNTSNKLSTDQQENSVAGTTTKVTPFQAYFQQVKAGLQEQNPSSSAEELLSIAMKSWKKLDADEKAQYSATSGSTSSNSVALKRKSLSEQEQDEANSDVTNEGLQSKKSKFDSSALLQQFSFS